MLTTKTDGAPQRPKEHPPYHKERERIQGANCRYEPEMSEVCISEQKYMEILKDGMQKNIL